MHQDVRAQGDPQKKRYVPSDSLRSFHVGISSRKRKRKKILNWKFESVIQFATNVHAYKFLIQGYRKKKYI